MPTQDYEAYDFSGGVNKTTSPLRLLPNELSDALNVLPATRGAVTRRYGYTAYNDTQISSGKAVTGLCRFYREGSASDVLLAACNEAIYDAATSGASTDLGSDAGFAIDAGTDVFFAPYRDRVYLSAYGSTNRKMGCVADDVRTSGTGHDSLRCWDWGVYAPARKPAVATQGGSGMTGTFSYKVTFWYGESGGHGESNAGPVSDDLVCSDDGARVTFFGSAGDGYRYADATAAIKAGVAKVYIYRTKADESTHYYRDTVTLTTSSDSYYDDTDDSDDVLDMSTEPPTDHNVPDAAKYVCLHRERMYIGNLHDGTDAYPKRVRWSYVGHPDIFAANSYADTPAEHGDIMGLFVLNGVLYIACQSAICRLDVYSSTDAAFNVVDETAGVKAPKSLAVGMDGGTPCAFFLGYDHRVYRFDGSRSQAISDDIDTIFTSDANQSYMGKCAGGWDGEYYYISYPDGTDTTNSAEARYSTQVQKMNRLLGYATGTWWPQDSVSAGCYCRWSGGDDSGELYWGNAGAAAWIYQANSGSDDNGTAISSYFETGLWDLGMGGWQKRFRSVLFDMKSWVTVTCRWDIDWNRSSRSFSAPSSEDLPEYDTGLLYDSGVYYLGDVPARKKYKFPSHHEGNRIRFKVSASESNAPYTVYGWTTRFIPIREDE